MLGEDREMPHRGQVFIVVHFKIGFLLTMAHVGNFTTFYKLFLVLYGIMELCNVLV